MDRKRLCVCIPTYNRCDAVKTVLDAELDIFEKYGIDLFLCDSSTNDEIKRLTERYKRIKECSAKDKPFTQGEEDAGHGGKSASTYEIHYKRFHSNISSNEKVFQIFQWAASSEYAYIWLIHDHTVCNEDAVRFLMQELEKGLDFYLLNMQSGGYGNEAFADINEFLLKGAWRLNSFGSSVINTRTFLKNVDWQRMRTKYGGEKTLNYSHIGFYFERAAELDSLKACQLFFERKDFVDFYRTNEISWSGDILRICLECWGEVITRLPEVYKDKPAVMRTQDKWFLSRYSLLVYRKEQKYNFKLFRKYGKWIKRIYPEDYIRDFWISVLPVRWLFRYYTGNLRKRMSEVKSREGNVYIFGAGRHAAECGAFFEECRLPFDGFVVTSLQGNPNELRNHTVYEAAARLKGQRSLVVIAVLSSGIEGVKKGLADLTDDATVIETITFAI